jgi:hypothetical protein
MTDKQEAGERGTGERGMGRWLVWLEWGYGERTRLHLVVALRCPSADMREVNRVVCEMVVLWFSV